MKPAAGAEARRAKYQYCNKGNQADDIKNRGLVEDEVVVEARQSKHDDEAEDQPFNLLVVHAFKAAAGVSGGVNLKHTQGADGHEDGDKPPIVVAVALSSVFHRSFPLALEELVWTAGACSSLMAIVGATTAVPFAGLAPLPSAVTVPGAGLLPFFLS